LPDSVRSAVKKNKLPHFNVLFPSDTVVLCRVPLPAFAALVRLKICLLKSRNFAIVITILALISTQLIQRHLVNPKTMMNFCLFIVAVSMRYFSTMNLDTNGAHYLLDRIIQGLLPYHRQSYACDLTVAFGQEIQTCGTGARRPLECDPRVAHTAFE
jgi:hypothetical protein